METNNFPPEIRRFLSGAELYDSSCSEFAKVFRVEKGNGYFLKIADKGRLANEAVMYKYFHSKGLSAGVAEYISAEKDYMLTERVAGKDCRYPGYLAEPELLCETLAENMLSLHSLDYDGCPLQNKNLDILSIAEKEYAKGGRTQLFDESGFADAHEAYEYLKWNFGTLRNGSLIHGDFCLPNIMLEDFKFTGYIDLDLGGVGDRHWDIFWCAWSVWFNIGFTESSTPSKQAKYREYFLDCYGRGNIDGERLRLCAILASFIS